MSLDHPRDHLWLPVANAARHLGVTEHAVRQRVKAGTIETRREVVGNRSRLLVKVDAEATDPANPEVHILRERIQNLELLVRELRGERDFLRAELTRELERRRWPGLWPTLRRLIYGVENP